MKKSPESGVWSLESERHKDGAAAEARADTRTTLQSTDSRLSTPDSRLVVDGVRKSFRDPSGGVLEVLRGVTFTLGAGETLAVVGASGAGKSTLLHVLGGLEEADGGSARLGRVDLMRAGAAELARLRGREIGFVFQFHHLLADLTAEENVALPLMVARRSRRESRREALALLERVGLKERARHRAGELSGGEQQRAAVARALVTRPRLVLADEPTGNLDAANAEQTAALLFSLCRDASAALVLATHSDALARACDRRLVLRDGKLEEESGVRSPESKTKPIPVILTPDFKTPDSRLLNI
jgi:lipoprotein-releasing system ATP-binding protein